MSEDAALSSYEERIAELDATDSEELINNSSTDHAIPLIARLFARGHREVGVLSGSLNPLVYANEKVVEALGVFLLGRAGKLKIVIEKQPDVVSDAQLFDSEGLLGLLRDRFGAGVLNQVFVRRAPASLPLTSHFLFVDKSGFRIEPDSSKHEAVASFNRSDVTLKLRTLFDGVFEASDEIHVGSDHSAAMAV